jgi:succinate-semialdehyde dehydrogenase/glutarate-semialdehyde dehydrogenase
MKMMIDGKFADASNKGTIAVHNSATQEFLETVPSATEADVLSAISAAQEGKKLWGDCQIISVMRF